MDVAAVQSDDQRQVRAGQFRPVGGAAGDEARPFVAEFVLQALRGGLQLAPHLAATHAHLAAASYNRVAATLGSLFAYTTRQGLDPDLTGSRAGTTPDPTP